MTVSIGGVAIPDSMNNRGRYTFYRQQTRLDGQGQAVAYGQQRVVWVFSYMTQTEFDWWIARLGGEVSKTLNSVVLWDDTNTERTFTAGELYRPTYDYYTGGLYYNVTVEIGHLMPILT